MKTVPFVANHPDNLHCVSAVFRMVHQFYFHRDMSWSRWDSILHSVKGLGTWTVCGEMYLAKKGIRVRNIELTDYSVLYREGIGYFDRIFGKKTAEYYRLRTNIIMILPYIPHYLKLVAHESRQATIAEIVSYIKEESLVAAELNSSILNGVAGFNLHMVLIIDYDSDGLFIHDPGFPACRSRHVSYSQFTKCFQYPGANPGITVFS